MERLVNKNNAILKNDNCNLSAQSCISEVGLKTKYLIIRKTDICGKTFDIKNVPSKLYKSVCWK